MSNVPVNLDELILLYKREKNAKFAAIMERTQVEVQDALGSMVMAALSGNGLTKWTSSGSTNSSIGFQWNSDRWSLGISLGNDGQATLSLNVSQIDVRILSSEIPAGEVSGEWFITTADRMFWELATERALKEKK